MTSSRFIAAFLFIALSCARRPEVPVDLTLWRVTAGWAPLSAASDDARRGAPATILIFRGNGEFVELHCRLIQQPDETVYISSEHASIVAIGRWREDDGAIGATRDKVARRTRTPSATEPLCEARNLSFRVSGNSVIGEAGEGSPGTYSPVTRLVAPDFLAYTDQAKTSGVSCVPEEK